MISYKLYIPTMPCMVIMDVILLLCVVATFGSTKLKVTAPVNPVQVGRILSIHCHIWDIDANHIITISRDTADNDEQVISVDKVLLDNTEAASRFFVAERQLGDGSTVFFLSIIEVTREDQGEYWCKVKSSNMERIIVSQSVIVDLTFFPGDSSPSCSPHQAQDLIEGKMVTFNCTSEKGNPTVGIKWSRAGYDIRSESPVESQQRSMVYSVLRFTPKLSDNGAVFLCIITSSAFPDKPQQCHVGPLIVKENPSATHYPGNTPTDKVLPTEQQIDITFDKPAKDTKKSTRPSAKCQEACSAFSSPVFYWVIATIVAGVVAVVFLITGIVLYVKYCRIVALGKERRFACRQSADDVYEKLEYKKNDKTLYMSLDKHGMKADTQGGIYGQASIGVHYNATPTHIRPQFS